MPKSTWVIDISITSDRHTTLMSREDCGTQENALATFPRAVLAWALKNPSNRFEVVVEREGVLSFFTDFGLVEISANYHWEGRE